MELKEQISTLPTDFMADSSASALHLSPDGRFIYAANRGHDSIASFAFDEDSGELERIGHISTSGEFPRDFVIDPSGRFLLVANQNSDNVVIFRIDPQTGALESTSSSVTVPTPVCLKFWHL